MVVRRTIAHLKTRPHEERRRVAVAISIGVMLVLFLGWAAYVVHEMFSGTPQSPTSPDFHSAFSSEAVQQAGAQLQQAYNNVSNLNAVASSSAPSANNDADVREIQLGR